MSETIHYMHISHGFPKMSSEKRAPPWLSTFYTTSEYKNTILMRFFISLLQAQRRHTLNKQTNKQDVVSGLKANNSCICQRCVIKTSYRISGLYCQAWGNFMIQRWLRIMKRGGKPELKFQRLPRLTLHTLLSRGGYWCCCQIWHTCCD